MFSQTGKYVACHGTVASYTNGKCRCRLCRDAVADYMKQRRARAAAGHVATRQRSSVVSHGTISGYGYHRCRCTDCRAAWATYCRERKASLHGAFRERYRKGHRRRRGDDADFVVQEFLPEAWPTLDDIQDCFRGAVEAELSQICRGDFGTAPSVVEPRQRRAPVQRYGLVRVETIPEQWVPPLVIFNGMDVSKRCCECNDVEGYVVLVGGGEPSRRYGDVYFYPASPARRKVFLEETGYPDNGAPR